MTYMELSSSGVTLEFILGFPAARCSEEPPIIPQSIITENFILMVEFVIHALQGPVQRRPLASLKLLDGSSFRIHYGQYHTP